MRAVASHHQAIDGGRMQITARWPDVANSAVVASGPAHLSTTVVVGRRHRLPGAISTAPAAMPCAANCNGRGICTYGKCFCDPGFSGEACDVSTKCPQDCNGNGVCHRGKCDCHPGFEGEACESGSVRGRWAGRGRAELTDRSPWCMSARRNK